jgi:hypothetical protein
MATSVKQMMEIANTAVPRITPAQAQAMMAKGNTLMVDVRDAQRSKRAARSRALFMFRAACWSFAPTRGHPTTTRISPGGRP